MKKISSIFNQSTVSITIAIIGVLFTVLSMLINKKPEIQYEVISSAKVFNNTEDLFDVKVLVDTVDVLKRNQNISYFVIKVQNVGNNDLSWNGYDKGMFGLSIYDGEILQGIDIVDASDPHIIERYSEEYESYSKCFIPIPKISLDSDEWYKIAFGVLHNNDRSPSFIPQGKIIGQKQIKIVPLSDNDDEEYFLKKIFAGNALINIARALIYLIVWFIIFLILGFIVSKIVELVDNKKERRVLNDIAKSVSISSFVRDDYVKNKDLNIRIASHYYGLGCSALNELFVDAAAFLSDPRNITNPDYERNIESYKNIYYLLEKGYLYKDDNGNLIIPSDYKTSVDIVREVLTKNHMLSHWENSSVATLYHIDTDEGLRIIQEKIQL